MWINRNDQINEIVDPITWVLRDMFRSLRSWIKERKQRG